MIGHPGTAMQPACRGEVEEVRIAADFEQDAGKRGQIRCLLGDPERIGKFLGLRQKKVLRPDSEALRQTRRIGPSCLPENFSRPDPDQQAVASEHSRQRKCEACGRACLTGGGAMDLHHAARGHATAQCCIETGCAGGKDRRNGLPRLSRDHTTGFHAVLLEPLWQHAFDLRNFMAQGTNDTRRHGGTRHVVHLRCVPVMFLWIPEARLRVKRAGGEFIPAEAFRLPPIDAVGLESTPATGYMRAKGSHMARIYQTRAWHNQLSPSIDELELMALEAYAHLPEEFRTLTGEIVIQIAEFPTEEIMDDLSLETPFDLLGLFEGRGLAERWNPATGEGPNRVTLYRRAILDYWAENEETMGDIVTHVLIHEIGHHFGLSDDDMQKIESSVE